MQIQVVVQFSDLNGNPKRERGALITSPADANTDSNELLVPRLCLGTHCIRGSASKAGRACKALRSEAEPGNEVLLAFAGVMIKALAGPRTITQLSAAAARHPGWGRGDFPKF